MGVPIANRDSRQDNAYSDGSNPIDMFIGSRIRLRRTMAGLSQKQLAVLLGIALQQVQNYESGENRVGAARLFEISRVLGTPISYFFDDMPIETPENSALNPAYRKRSAREQRGNPDVLVEKRVDERETMELVYAFYRISKDIRGLTLDLIKSLAIPEMMQ